jgi:hypothetical protein
VKSTKKKKEMVSKPFPIKNKKKLFRSILHFETYPINTNPKESQRKGRKERERREGIEQKGKNGGRERKNRGREREFC